MTIADHAFLPPSSAHIWKAGGCHVWPLMNQTFPELVPQQPALEGSAAHWGIETELGGTEAMAGARAPNGIVLDDEMVEAVEVFMQSIHHLRAQELHVEKTIVNKAIHESLNWGTPDLWTFVFPFLDIVDFKYGHEFVDAFENDQGINYAALILESMGISTPAARSQITVRITIVQPRSFHPIGPVRTWSIQADKLQPYIEKLRLGATETLRPDPIARVGTYCDHCPGRHACVILQRTAESAADRAGAVLPMELPPEAVGIELRSLMRAARLLDARVTGLQAQAEGLMQRGVRVPHFMMESNPGREKWHKPIEEVIAIGDAMGVKVSRPDVITPNQARKAGLSESIVAAMANRPSGAAELTLDDGTKARRVFGN